MHKQDKFESYVILKKIISFKISVILIVYTYVPPLLGIIIPLGITGDLLYKYKIPVMLQKILIYLGSDNYFNSLLFIIPALPIALYISLFTIKLILIKKKRGWKNPGILMFHIGALIIIAGGLLSYFSKTEEIIYLGKGDKITLPRNYQITLQKLKLKKNSDGTPKDWISVVELKNSKGVLAIKEIKATLPLALGSTKIYQNSFKQSYKVHLRNNEDREIVLTPGKGIDRGYSRFIYAGLRYDEHKGGKDEAIVIFEEHHENKVLNKLYINFNDEFESYRITDISRFYQSGLKIIWDEGRIPVFLGILIISASLFLMIIERIFLYVKIEVEHLDRV